MERTQQSTAGLRIEHLDNGRILTFVFDDISRDTIDTWVATFTELLEQGEQPYRVLMDVSAPHLAFTPYFRQRSQEIVNQYQHVSGYMAIVFRSHFFAAVVDLFMRAQRKKHFEPRCFTNYEQAEAWLRTIG